MYGTILTAIDTTPEGERVLAQVSQLAKLTGDPVHVLHSRALDIFDGAAGGTSVVTEEQADDADAVVNDALRTLTDAGVPADGEINESLRAALAKSVLEAAERLDAGLIALGTRRHNALGSLFAGSVSDTVAHHAPCPILLVP